MRKITFSGTCGLRIHTLYMISNVFIYLPELRKISRFSLSYLNDTNIHVNMAEYGVNVAAVKMALVANTALNHHSLTQYGGNTEDARRRRKLSFENKEFQTKQTEHY